MENASPKVKPESAAHAELRIVDGKLSNVCSETVFEAIRSIKDPEHPYTLEQLSVVCAEDIAVGCVGDDASDIVCRKGLPIKCISVTFTPTVPHCSLAGIIGLCIRHRLENLTRGYWIRVFVKEETHVNYLALNKQLNDRDRVMAAFENEGLMDVIKSCLEQAE